MAQREYEEQPEAPDLASVVQLNNSDTLAGPAGDVDALDAGYVPPDRPYALDEGGVTVAGQQDGDTLDERLAREVPEEVPVDLDRAGRLADPEQDGAMGRSDDVEGYDVGISGGGASAEEAAMHVVDLGTDPDVLADEEGGEASLSDPGFAETLAGDPYADAAEVDAARDLRATDEGSARSADDGTSADRGADRSGRAADPALPEGRDRA